MSKRTYLTTVKGDCCEPLVSDGDQIILRETTISEASQGALVAIETKSGGFFGGLLDKSRLGIFGVVIYPANPEAKHGPLQFSEDDIGYVFLEEKKS